jgi:deoxyribose-phosphate aldolase
MKLNKYIDHTLLKPEATKAMVQKLCEEAKEHDFMSVCINSYWVSYCKKQLEGSDVLVCTVIGFPLGANAIETKAYETETAVSHGADEIDMVINIGAVKDGNYDYLVKEISAVVEAAMGRTVKVIIETCLLTDDEKILACKAALDAKASFVKTSTGFSTGGATAEDVKLMKSVVGNNAKVKASGGVRSSEDLEKMIAAGAERIGTSSGVQLVSGKIAETNY